MPSDRFMEEAKRLRRLVEICNRTPERDCNGCEHEIALALRKASAEAWEEGGEAGHFNTNQGSKPWKRNPYLEKP